MSITGWRQFKVSLFTELSLIFDQVYFCSFFDPLCTVYSFKTKKGRFCSVVLERSARCCKEMSVFFSSLGCLIFSCWYSRYFQMVNFRPKHFCFLLFGLLQSAFQTLIVHSSGLKKVLFSKRLRVVQSDLH